MSLDQIRTPEPPQMQRMLYPLENIVSVDHVPFSVMRIKPEQCTPICGIRVQGRWQAFMHVVRKIVTSSQSPAANELHAGADKLVFYNYDVHGTLHWQAVYSTALFLGEDYQIFTV